MTHNPNFPTNLDITPSQSSDDASIPHSFDFAAQEEAIREYGIAGRVWEAAYFMNTYINSPIDMQFDPPFISSEEEAAPQMILELGSGTGIVSAQCMKRLTGTAATIIATDLPEVCPLLERNLCSDSGVPGTLATPRLLIRSLAWGNGSHASAILDELLRLESDSMPRRAGPNILSHIICSDLVYFPELLAPLLRSLLQLTSPPFVGRADSELWPRVVVAYKVRSLAKEMPFWSAFGLWFAFEPVLARRVASASQKEGDGVGVGVKNTEPWTRFGADGDGDVFVFVAQRRVESLEWEVPSDDAELLGGVGTRGTQYHKSDDTFETLLLMGLSSE